jgi:hypothetical protein
MPRPIVVGVISAAAAAEAPPPSAELVLTYDSSLHWDDGLAKAMINHHSNKLTEIRMFASDWHDCLLGNYVYLQDARHKTFFAESMTRALWRQQRTIGSDTVGVHEDESDTEESSSAGPWCSHCRRHSLHPRAGKNHYLLKKLAAAQARDLLKDFEVHELLPVAHAAAKSVSAAIASNADADTTAILADVRTQFGK